MLEILTLVCILLIFLLLLLIRDYINLKNHNEAIVKAYDAYVKSLLENNCYLSNRINKLHDKLFNEK